MLGSDAALAASLNSERLHTTIKMAAVDAHQFGCARDVAFGFGQLSLNEFTVIGIGGLFEGGKAEGGCGRLFSAERRQVARPDFYFRVHDDDALDRVAQLAHVAWP